MKETQDNLKQRDEYLFKCYRDIYREACKTDFEPDKNKVIRTAMKSGRPRFYFSFDNAMRKVAQFDNGKLPHSFDSETQKMWKEFYDVVCALRRRHKQWSRSKAVQCALSETRASRFFMTFKYASKIINRQLYLMRHEQPTSRHLLPR